jgi:hypothetical protein
MARYDGPISLEEDDMGRYDGPVTRFCCLWALAAYGQV